MKVKRMSSGCFRTALQYLVPQHALSRLAGRVANSRKPKFKNWLIDTFIQHYGVDMRCATQTDPHAYPDFNSFFTRTLRPETRPIAQQTQAIACPVDGIVSQVGIADAHNLLQAKGSTYDTQRLLGGSAERAAPFLNGHFVTLYLAPKDYHRVHMPITGRLREMVHMPGQLFSVNALTARKVPNLFARNERVIALFDTAAGPMAIVFIGAMLVASISTVWAGLITPPSAKQPRIWQYDDQNINLSRGKEVGHFKLGSTVIVLFGPNSVKWANNIQPEQPVRLGQLLGQLTK